MPSVSPPPGQSASPKMFRVPTRMLKFYFIFILFSCIFWTFLKSQLQNKFHFWLIDFTLAKKKTLFVQLSRKKIKEGLWGEVRALIFLMHFRNPAYIILGRSLIPPSNIRFRKYHIMEIFATFQILQSFWKEKNKRTFHYDY